MIIFYSFFSFGHTAQFLFTKLNRRKILRFMHMHCCAYQTMHHVRYAFKSTFIFFSKVAYHFCVIQVHVNCYEPQTFFFLHHISVMIVNLTFPLFFSPFFSSNSMMLMILISRNIFHASLKISFSPFFQFLVSKKFREIN